MAAEVIARQLVRSGTSVGANYREAGRAESRNDFIHKIAIATKELSETIYWLELLLGSGTISPGKYETLSKEAEELLRILTASGRTAKENRRKTQLEIRESAPPSDSTNDDLW